MSYQIKRDFTDTLPLLQSPPAPPLELQRSQPLVESAHCLKNRKIVNACVQWWCKDLTWRYLLLLAHVRHSPSAVPCTRRYFTEWKFLALPVTVEFCTQFALIVTDKGLSDTTDERLGCSSETYEVGVRVLRRLHHVALCVDGICNKECHNYRHSTLDLETMLVWKWWKLP